MRIREHHFENEKEHFICIILDVVGIQGLVGPQIALYTSGQ